MGLLHTKQFIYACYQSNHYFEVFLTWHRVQKQVSKASQIIDINGVRFKYKNSSVTYLKNKYWINDLLDLFGF